jgi:hypothetical protein
MPSFKSSSLIDEQYRQLIHQKAAEGDHLSLLTELLSLIHRDGGQYTVLVGLPASVEDAMKVVLDLRSQLRMANYLNKQNENG